MFKLRPEHAAALRRSAFRDALGKSFQRSGLSPAEDPENGDLLVTDAEGHRTRLAFDHHGFVGGIVSPLGRTWILENDSQGRNLRTVNPAGHELNIKRDPQGQPVRLSRGSTPMVDLEYDDRGSPSKLSYPDKTTRVIDTDPAGRLQGLTDRLGHREAYEHDGEGLLKGITDGNGNRTQFEYGNWDRPDRAVFPDGSSESYEYNPAGLVAKITVGADAVAEIEYDEQGKPTKLVYQDGEVIELAYNENGQVVQASNPEGRIEYQYDARGLLLLEKQEDQVIQYLYDDAGALMGLTYPTGERIELSYDADQRLSRIRDWNAGVHAFHYSEADRSFQIVSPSGVSTTVEQTETGLPQSVLVKEGARGREILFLRYEYDAEDRVQRFRDSQFGTREYVYDAESQVLEVRAEAPGRSESFAYDAAGNRNRVGGATAELNELNQLVRQGGIQCRYDPRGNLVFFSPPEGEWRFTYSKRNLLIRADGPAGRCVTFGYDAFGRRVWKRCGNIEVRYIWGGEHLFREITRTGSFVSIRDYLYLPGTPTPLATRIDGKVYSYHTDHLGTPRRLTDESGEVVWSADFSAYGQAQIAVEKVANPLRFPGQYFDSETGLHYNRFRYYSPVLGRYLSRDPVTYLGGLNFYAYVGNNPVNAADPLGLWWKAALSIVAAVAVGIVVGVLLAPISIPAAIILGGAAAGAIGFGLNEALNQESFCFSCILKEMGRGALIGALAAVPFLFLPATAGVVAVAAAGGASGAISYIADWATNPDAVWSWGDFGKSVAFGAVTAGLSRYLGPKFAQWRGNRNIPKGGQSIAQRQAQGGKPPVKVSDNPGKYYYDPKSGRYKLRPQPPRKVDPRSTQAKGTFGEKRADAYMKGKGFDKVGGGNKHQGIDGVYENATPPPKYVVGEAKYGTSKLGQTKDGRQMSDKWVDKRLDQAVGKEKAQQIRKEGYEKWEIRIDENGNVTHKPID